MAATVTRVLWLTFHRYMYLTAAVRQIRICYACHYGWHHYVCDVASDVRLRKYAGAIQLDYNRRATERRVEMLFGGSMQSGT